MEMSKEAREALNAYNRKRYAENKEKFKEYRAKYWERKAAELKERTGTKGEKENG